MGCAVGGPAWNPDGTAIAFFEACESLGWGIKALDRSGGTLDWSRSGERLAFHAEGAGGPDKRYESKEPEGNASRLFGRSANATEISHEFKVMK